MKIRILVLVVIVMIGVLAWAPWMNDAQIHDWVYQKYAGRDGTSATSCDYVVMWAPFGRWVASCEGGYYIRLWERLDTN